MVQDRYLHNMNEKELYDTASDMNSELESCIDYLEQMRTSNGQLRDWGEELESDLNSANDSITHLEETILELSKEHAYTQSELDAARIEGAELGWDTGFSRGAYDEASYNEEPPTKEQFFSSLNKPK